VLTEVVYKDKLAPERCRWCDVTLNGFDDGARDALRWSSTSTANLLSNLTGFGLAPASAFGLLAVASVADGRGRNWPTDAVVVLETALIAGDMNQLVKMVAGRRRPYVRFGPDPDAPARSFDENLSFYSGHASYTFALAVASGTVASIRDYRGAPYVWATGLTAAALTSYLRIAADKHYATDVLTGALIGSATGFAIPYLFHRRRSAETPVIGITPTTVSLSVAW